VEDSSNAEEEAEGRETYRKLSAIHAIKRDTSVVTAPSIHGIDPTISATGPQTPAEDVTL